MPSKAMLSPADKYMVLLTTLSVQVEGVLTFHALTSADIGRLAKRPLKGKNLTYSEYKFRMKAFGSLVFSYQRFVTELSLLALAKAFEDLIFEARDLGCSGFDIWKNDELNFRYHRDVRYIRALANTIKHSNSRVIDNKTKNSRFLMDQCGMKPDSQVEYLKVDIPRYTYRTYWFLDQLAAYLAGIKQPHVPKREGTGFASFKKSILPTFLKP